MPNTKFDGVNARSSPSASYRRRRPACRFRGKLPASLIAAIRSRIVSLPNSCWRATLSAPPICSARRFAAAQFVDLFCPSSCSARVMRQPARSSTRRRAQRRGAVVIRLQRFADGSDDARRSRRRRPPTSGSRGRLRRPSRARCRGLPPSVNEVVNGSIGIDLKPASLKIGGRSPARQTRTDPAHADPERVAAAAAAARQERCHDPRIELRRLPADKTQPSTGAQSASKIGERRGRRAKNITPKRENNKLYSGAKRAFAASASIKSRRYFVRARVRGRVRASASKCRRRSRAAPTLSVATCHRSRNRHRARCLRRGNEQLQSPHW